VGQGLPFWWLLVANEVVSQALALREHDHAAPVGQQAARRARHNAAEQARESAGPVTMARW